MPLTQVDRELLNRCLKNETGAWKDFVDRYIGLFFHVIRHTANARSVRLSDDDVDDITAEVLVQLVKHQFEALKKFRGESSLATYLTVIARRVVVREITSRRNAEALGHVSAYGASHSWEESTENEEIVRIENREHVDRLISILSDHEAAVVTKFHLEGQSYQEISSTLNIPENSVGPTLSRAREHLRQLKLS